MKNNSSNNKEKMCYRCKKIKPFEAFNRDSSKHNGVSSACRECTKIVSKEKDRRIAAQNAQKRWREINTEKTKAHQIAHYAMSKGNLVKEPCFLCGEKKVHGHHLDYRFPLKVVWLCEPHHKRAHLIGTIS